MGLSDGTDTEPPDGFVDVDPTNISRLPIRTDASYWWVEGFEETLYTKLSEAQEAAERLHLNN